MENEKIEVKKLEKIRRPKLIKNVLIVFNGYGRMVRVLDPLKMAVQYLMYDNDTLCELNGFNWVPEEPYYKMAREIIERNNPEEIQRALGIPDIDVHKANGIVR